MIEIDQASHRTPFRSPRKLAWGIGLAVWAFSASCLVAAEPTPPGEALYKTLCAACHGAKGEGVENEYASPLQGDRSLEDLAQLIHDTMPADDPDQCTGDEAKKVAEYVYHAFYSREARVRLAPPRIALSHLTVRQYANTVADLIGSFTGEGRLDEARGLKAQYFNARNFRGDKKVLDRVDPQLIFDFGEDSPDPAKIDKDEFSIQWRGGLIAEETGDYEFTLKTANGARLWVNDEKKPLIDAWVKSGDDTQHTASLRLLGGRVYPIRVDYFKFKDKTASIMLEWQPPHRAKEAIPERNLSPHWCPPLLVLETKFPPDDGSVGYERGTSVSASWDQATTYAALEIANKVTANLEPLAKCKADAPDRKQRLQEFCLRFTERAFRRPLTDEQKRFFVTAHFEGSNDLESAVKKVVLLVLKSPRFLYLGLHSGAPDDYEVASRLSFGLWDSLPDPELLRTAAQGKLRTPEEVARQAQRMLTSPRTRAKLRAFFHRWLRGDRASEGLAKDKQLFPDFDEAVASDLLTSLDLFVEEVVWSKASDFRQLLLADYLYLNDRLARFYDVKGLAGQGFQKVSLGPRQAGVLTHPYLMANYSYYKSTSPIHRGVFMVRSLLGRVLKPPPVAVAPLDEGFDPAMTTRQRVAFQTKPQSCQTCHALINPLGFSLEHYDAVGRYRDNEKGQPIDARGAYKTLDGRMVEFNGARELAEQLAESEEVHRSFVEQLFHYIVKQPVGAYGSEQLPNLTKSFVQKEFNVQKLLVEILRTTAFQPNHP